MRPERLTIAFLLSVLPLALDGIPAGASTRADEPAAHEIDAVLAAYDDTVSPGCALGVIRDGELIYQRGYGMANLEYGIALSPRSVFRTGSVGKQFTAMAIAILAEQGTISLDDSLRQYFPEFPLWAEDVTVRHLVLHTSGIRDYLTLATLTGMGDDDFYSDAFALDLLSRQKHLNFPPGEEYLYSNSGYLLLAHIVARATDQSLRQWAAENIFGPLGMSDTHFHDDHTHIVTNRASGYAPTEDGFRISETNLDMVGDGGVYTTIEDLLLWDRNFDDNKLGQGGPALIERVTTPGELNSGETMDYAFGLTVDEYRGLERIEDEGAFVGFRAHSLRFPEQGFSTYVLCNRADAEPGFFAAKVAELYLEELMEPLPASAMPEEKPGEVAQLSASDLDRLAGHYWSSAEREFLAIERVEDTLQISSHPDESFILEPRSADHLVLTTPWSEADLRFEPGEDDSLQLTMEIRGEDERHVYQQFTPRRLAAAELQAYTGSYFSQELNAEYVIATDGRSLTFEIERRGEHSLAAVFDEVFHNPEYGVFTFERDARGAVSGFSLDAGRVRNLEFDRH